MGRSRHIDRLRRLGPGLAGVGVVVAAAFGLVGLAGSGLFGQDAGSGSSSAPSDAVRVTGAPTHGESAVPPTAGSRPLSAEERAFAEAYLGLAESHDRETIELLIANPLLEWDLIGVPLTDVVDQTRVRLGGLPPLGLTAGWVRELEREMAATVALLRAVDEHAPQAERGTQYRRALDHWVEQVQPVSEAIRAALGLPPVAPGDLRL